MSCVIDPAASPRCKTLISAIIYLTNQVGLLGNSICFNRADLAFTPGVLAFTRVISADRIGW
jgi:hypothetical protein